MFLGNGKMQTCQPVSLSPPEEIRHVNLTLLNVLSGELSPLKTLSPSCQLPQRHPSLLSCFHQVAFPTLPCALKRVDSGLWGLIFRITTPKGAVLRYNASYTHLVPREAWLTSARTGVTGWPSPYRTNQSTLGKGHVLAPEASLQVPWGAGMFSSWVAVYCEWHWGDRRQC